MLSAPRRCPAGPQPQGVAPRLPIAETKYGRRVRRIGLCFPRPGTGCRAWRPTGRAASHQPPGGDGLRLW